MEFSEQRFKQILGQNFLYSACDYLERCNSFNEENLQKIINYNPHKKRDLNAKYKCGLDEDGDECIVSDIWLINFVHPMSYIYVYGRWKQYWNKRYWDKLKVALKCDLKPITIIGEVMSLTINSSGYKTYFISLLKLLIEYGLNLNEIVFVDNKKYISNADIHLFRQFACHHTKMPIKDLIIYRLNLIGFDYSEIDEILKICKDHRDAIIKAEIEGLTHMGLNHRHYECCIENIVTAFRRGEN